MNAVSRTECTFALLISIGAVSAFMPAQATSMQRYVTRLTPLLDAPEGKTIGLVVPGAAVMILEQSEAKAHVTLRGWSHADGGTTLYSSPKRPTEVLTAFIGSAAAEKSQSVGRADNHFVKADGWIASGAIVDNLNVVWSHASDLYRRQCALCHALPTINSYSAEEWSEILPTQAINAHLSMEEAALLQVYLETKSNR